MNKKKLFANGVMYMNKKKIAVVAGTKVDTKMGVDFLMSKGLNNVLKYPVSSSPEEQSKFQILSKDKLTEVVRKIIKSIKNEGSDTIMVYCNSLSAAVDMEKLSREEKINIVTPLQVYKKIAHKYKKIGVIAANNQSLAGIEKIVQSSNSECDVIGLGILPLVKEIEKGLEPSDIVKRFSLKSIMEFYNNIKVDTIILGCTHLPYLHKELKKYSMVPILDPGEFMYKMVCKE